MSAPGATPRAAAGAPATPPSPSTGSASTEGPDAALAPGATLGRYVLIEALGAGGMGMVFRARDPDLGREVAVKVLRTGEGSGGALERRLLREAQAMATVSHDNLANVFDIGTASGGRVFVAMELVDGGTLRQLIKDPAKSWRDKLAAVVAAGRGLAAAHSAGVIHRDFKPDNVLIAKTGRVKVVDFGLARADRDAVETVGGSGGHAALPADLAAHMTQTGALLGTPAYMAPEQHAGEVVDARSDQFGFAVTAWEAVYGQRPFASDAYSSLVAAVRAHDITPPPRGTGVPAALDAVLRRALSPERADRYTSMDAVITALEASIRPRRRTPWIAGGIAAAIVGGGVAIYAIAIRPAASTPRATRVTEIAGGSGAAAGRGSSAGQVETAAIELRVLPFDFADLAELDQLDGPDGKRMALQRMSIASVLSRHVEEGLACYHDAGVDRPGRVEIEFVISGDGQVESTRIVEDQFRGTTVASCIAAASMRWAFPSPSDRQPTTVRFPFVFEAAGEGGDGFDVFGGFGPDVPMPSIPGFQVPPVPPVPPAPRRTPSPAD